MSELGMFGDWRGRGRGRAAIVWTRLALGLWLGGVGAWAQDLIVHEPFEYPAGGLANKRGGVGFLNAWQGGVPDAPVTANFATEANSMAVNGLETGGGLVRASVQTVNMSGLRRTLTTSLGFNSTVRYLSFVARADGTLHAGLFNGFFGVRLIGSGAGHLYVGKPGGGAITRYVLEDAGGQRQHAATAVIPRGEPRLLVVKCEFRAGADRFSLFVNPQPGGEEPSLPDVVKDDLDVGFVSALALNSAGAWSVDELRVGTTWQSVTPKEPAFRLQLVEEKNGREHAMLENRVAPRDPLPEGRVLRFELVGETHGAEIDSKTGVIRWVPGELAGGQTWTLRVRATEEAQPDNTATVEVPIWVEEANQLAVVRPVETAWVSEGETLRLELAADDLDQPAQRLTFRLVEGPEGMTLGSTGELLWKPTSGQLDDSYVVRVTVDDGLDMGLETRFLVNTRSVTRAVVEVPEVSVSGAGESVVLSWPAEPNGNWWLETSSALGEGRWSVVDREPVLRGGRRELEIQADQGAGFFRLASRGSSGPVLTNAVVQSPGNLFGGRTWVSLQLERLPSLGQTLELVETSDAFERVRRIPHEFLQPPGAEIGFWLDGDELLMGQTLVQARWLDALGNRLGGVGFVVTNEPVAGMGEGPVIGSIQWGGVDGVVKVEPNTQGFVMPRVEMTLSDPNGDLARVELNWTGPNGERGSALRELRWEGPGPTNWSYLPMRFLATTSYGQWELMARVHDASGHRAQATVRLQHTATSFTTNTLQPPDLWSLSPTNAEPGQAVRLWVRDVEPADLTNAVVRIGGVPAQILGPFDGGLRVVVPLDTLGDRVELTTPKGGTTYRGKFRVETRPRLEPTLLTLLPGQAVMFRWDRRLPTGSVVNWTASAGEISAEGWYRAPAFAAQPIEARVRGAVTSAGETWEDDVVVKIEASPVARGAGWVSVAAGGSVWSEDLSTRVEFPPGAVTQDTVVTVRTLTAAERPEAPGGLTALGGAEFGPDGLQFGRPARLVLPVAMSQTIGSRIPVRIWDPVQRSWEDEVLEGVVGSSGREVHVEVHHFSTYVPMVAVALAPDAPVLESVEPEEIAEGLHGPVMLKGRGFGPGVSVDIVEADGTPAAGFSAGALVLGRLGPQGDDAHRAGFLLETPVLRNLGKGQIRTVFVRARKFGQPETVLPLRIRGLPEFETSDFASIPPGSSRFEGLYSEIVLRGRLSTLLDYNEFRATRRIVIERDAELDVTGASGMSGGTDVPGQPFPASSERRGGAGGQRGAGQNALVTADYAFPARGMRIGFGGQPGAVFADYFGTSDLADCTGRDALTCFEELLADLRDDPFEFQIVAERELTEFVARLPDGRRGSSGIWRGAPLSWALGGSGFIISDNSKWIRTYGPGSGGGGGGASGLALGIEGWNGSGGAGGMGGGGGGGSGARCGWPVKGISSWKAWCARMAGVEVEVGKST